MWLFVISVLGPVVANELGWAAAESGRQPWIVHPPVVRDSSGNFAFDSQGFIKFNREDGLRTKDAVSESINGGQVLGSIVMFSCIYALLGALWVFILNHKIHNGPQPVTIAEATTSEGFIAVTGSVGHLGLLGGTEEDDKVKG
jgi:cytochrome d ubiquinol oxidase subunit I